MSAERNTDGIVAWGGSIGLAISSIAVVADFWFRLPVRDLAAMQILTDDHFVWAFLAWFFLSPLAAVAAYRSAARRKLAVPSVLTAVGMLPWLAFSILFVIGLSLTVAGWDN